MGRKRRRIRRVRKNQILNLPSFMPGIRGKHWEIVEAPQHAVPNTLNHFGTSARMEIPFGDDPWDRYTRLHELLHAAISPLEPPHEVTLKGGEIVDKTALLLAEEVRVEAISRSKLGVDQLPERIDEITSEVVNKLMPLLCGRGGAKYVKDFIDSLFACWMGSPSQISNTHLLVQMRGWLTTAEGTIDQNFLTQGWNTVNWLTQAVEVILEDVWYGQLRDLFEDGTVPEWDDVLKLGYFITKMFEKSTSINPEAQKADVSFADMPDMEPMAKWIDQRNDGPPLQKQRKEMKSWMPNEGQPGPAPLPSASHDNVKWGSMTIREPRRPNRLPKTKVQRSKYTATDIGTHPKYVHRILIDGMAFARKRREPGGAVLIDDSGSMQFETHQIQDIVEAAPAVDIAAYSGGCHTGELVVIAKDGTWLTVTDETRPDGYNNLVDIPALEWLAQQNEPRIWVSDGYAIPRTGAMEQAIEDCAEFCRRNKINRVDNPEDARDVFLGRKEIYR